MKKESKNELKQIYIKNHASYYFDDIINRTDTNYSNILLEKSYLKTFQFMTFCIKLQWVQNHCVLDSFDKIDGFIMFVDDKIKHVVLFDWGLFNKIYNKIKYLMSKKRGIVNNINHNFGRIRID